MQDLLREVDKESQISSFLSREMSLVIPVRVLWELVKRKIDFKSCKSVMKKDTVPTGLYYDASRKILAISLCSLKFSQVPAGCYPPELYLDFDGSAEKFVVKSWKMIDKEEQIESKEKIK